MKSPFWDFHPETCVVGGHHPSAGGVGTTEIMRRTGKSKTVDPDQIIATVKRGYQALDSFH